MTKKIEKRIKELKKDLKELEEDWKLAQQKEYNMLYAEYLDYKFEIEDEIKELMEESK